MVSPSRMETTWPEKSAKTRDVTVTQKSRNTTNKEMERCIQVGRSTPKSGESRRVDMPLELAQTLKDLFLERQVEAGANGTEVPPWVFCNENGGLLHPHNLRDRIF
jgi:hypothetical protein